MIIYLCCYYRFFHFIRHRFIRHSLSISFVIDSPHMTNSRTHSQVNVFVGLYPRITVTVWSTLSLSLSRGRRTALSPGSDARGRGERSPPPPVASPQRRPLRCGRHGDGRGRHGNDRRRGTHVSRSSDRRSAAATWVSRQRITSQNDLQEKGGRSDAGQWGTRW